MTLSVGVSFMRETSVIMLEWGRFFKGERWRIVERLHSWVSACVTDSLHERQPVCMIDRQADRPAGNQADSLLADRWADWYADLTDD